MRRLLSVFSSVMLLMLCALCPWATAKAQVPTPAQIITDGDWIVERVGGATKSGDRFVMRFDRTKKIYRTGVIEVGDTQEIIEKKRRDLSLADPEGKWMIQNGKIRTERFIGGWWNDITVNGKRSFRMANKGGTQFEGKKMEELP